MDFLMAGGLLGLQLGVYCPDLRLPWAFAALVLLVPLSRTRPLVWGLIGLVWGVLWSQSVVLGPDWSGFVHVRGRVCSPVSGQEISICTADFARTGEVWQFVEGRISARFRDQVPSFGDYVAVSGWAESVADRTLPGAPDRGYLRRRAGIRTVIRVHEWSTFGGGLSSESSQTTGSPLLLALATGDKSRLSEEQIEVFRRTGTAHLLAVSGLHVGFVGWFVLGLTQLLFRPLVLVWPQGSGTHIGLFAGVIAVLGYAALVEASASASRAALMFCVWAALYGLGRRPEPSRCLLLVAFALAIIDPMAMGRVSFQMSIGAVWGICIFYPHLSETIDATLPRALGWVGRSLALSCCATVGTLPAVAWWFQSIAVWGPFANLLAVPLVSLILVPCALWVHLSPFGEWWVVFWIAERAENVLMTFLREVPELTLHPAVDGVGALCLCVLALVRPRWEVVLLAVGLVFGLRESPRGATVEVLDVGQGSAALVYLTGQAPILVDGGPPGSGVLAFLRRRRIERLSAVVASHGDADHVGGLLEILDQFPVEEVWLGGLGKADELKAKAREQAIPVYGCAGLLARSLPVQVWCDLQPDNENDASLVIRTEHVVFLGDLSIVGEHKFIAAEQPKEVDVLVLGHHGSKYSTAPKTLDVLQPKLALVSASRRNRYGHPHAEVRQRVHAVNASLLSTSEYGTIQLQFGPAKRVRYHRSIMGWSGWVTLDELRPDGLRIGIPRAQR